MSALFSVDLGHAQLAVYGSALGVALIGSGHCFGMCGGIAALVGKRRAPSYHFGRGIAYATIGAVAGGFGQGVFLALQDRPGTLVLLVTAFVAVFVAQAFLVWNGTLDQGPVARVQRGLYRKWLEPAVARAARSSNGWIYGFATVLIPCGWILAFASMAAATGSAISGAILLTILWLGSLPALLAAASFWGALRRRLHGTRGRKIMALAVLGLSFASLFARVSGIESTFGAKVPGAPIHCGPTELLR